MSQSTSRSVTITLSTATIIKAAAAILGLWLVYVIGDVLLLVLAAVFLAAALRPGVDKLERHHIPRPVSMISAYVILLIILTLIGTLVVPPLAHELSSLASAFPNAYAQISRWATDTGTNDGPQLLRFFEGTITSAGRNAFGIVSDFFGGIFSFFIVLVLTFYLVVDEDAVRKSLAFAPQKHQAYLTNLYERLQKKVGRWLRAQLTIMVAVGLLTYVALTITGYFTGMRYALVLALIAGLTEFIPYVGPLISAVPAVLVAWTISPTTALIVAIVYYGIQLFENNVLTPKVMERALGLSPIVSIVVFLVGAQLAGIPGAFLAIPIATAGTLVLKDLLSARTSPEHLV